MSLPSPLSDADPYHVQESLAQIRQEMEQAARGNFGSEDIHDRLDRLEAFTLLLDQHAANVFNAIS